MSKNIINDIWIDADIFSNGSIGGIANTEKLNGLDSAYRIWEEANNTILNSNDNNEILNQGFLSLKRAFNVTSIQLRKYLALDKIMYKSKKKNKDFLADLEYFEIIKTLTLSKYLNIRNLIEHENYAPPSIEDCLSLSEYIWNYIRNTVNILNQFFEIIIFTDNDSCNKMIFEYQTLKIKEEYFPHLNITSFIKSNLISFVPIENAVLVENVRLMGKDELNNKIEFKKEVNYIDELNYLAFEGEILDQDVTSRYIKHLILPEFGGLDEQSIKTIF